MGVPPDRLRIDERLERIEEGMRGLAEARSTPLAAWRTDPMLQAATERRLQVAVQAAIDIGGHLIATQGWRTAETYGQVFEELGRQGVLDRELVGRMVLAAGLRNLLVHQDLDLDLDRLHGTLGGAERDLAALCASVLEWLDQIS